MKKFVSLLIDFFINSLLAVTFIFFILRLAPGDPVERILGQDAKKEDIEIITSRLGLDRPLYYQFGIFLKQLASFNLGDSLIKKKPVSEMITQSLKVTLCIGFLASALSLLVGTFLGVLQVYLKEKKVEKLIRALTLIGVTLPVFSLGPLLVLLFSIRLNLLPVSEWGELTHVILPVMTIVIPFSCIISKVTRNRFLEEVTVPWVQVLYGKGLSHFQVYLRVLKAITPTILNVMAIQLSVVLAGTMVTETIFDLPGIGSLLFEGIQNRDYPVVQGVVIYSMFVYLLVYLFVENLNKRIDPRIK